MGGGNVVVIKNKSEWEEHLKRSREQGVKIAVDFTATWCGPCRAIGPFFGELSTQYAGEIVFLQVDVDECSDVAQACSISAMPTFHFFKNGEKVAELVGASKDKLQACLADLQSK